MNDDKPLDPWVIVIGVICVVGLAAATIGALIFA